MRITKIMRQDYIQTTGIANASDEEIWIHYFGPMDIEIPPVNTFTEMLKCTSDIITSMTKYYIVCTGHEPDQILKTGWHYKISEMLKEEFNAHAHKGY